MTGRLESNTAYSEQTFERLSLTGDEIASTEFVECVFVRCSFAKAIFRACTFEECTFEDCDLSLISLPHCAFSATKLVGCKAIGVNWTEARWPAKRIWPPLAFERCVLDHSTFLGLDLKGVRFKDCVVRDADFREAALVRSDFSGTDLSRALFGDTDLTEADLRGAINYSIDPTLNVVKGASFSLPDALALLAGLGVEISDPDD